MFGWDDVGVTVGLFADLEDKKEVEEKTIDVEVDRGEKSVDK